MKEEANKIKFKRKTNIFIVFLICSSLIWLISKLSETYTQRSSFGLSYVNAPDSLLLTGASKQSVDVRLRASGFKFLSFNFGKEELSIDLSQVRKRRNSYFITREAYQKQIENQLPGNISLMEIDQDTLFVHFEKLYSKEVSIVPDLNLNFAQNHQLEGELIIDPPNVVIKGPQKEIENIEEILTVNHSMSGISKNFSSSIALVKLPGLENTTYSNNEVKISGSVFRFSEQLIDVPVKVINLPQGVEIKTFPNVVSILCKAQLERLKSLRPAEFELVADFNSAKPDVKILEVQLVNQPKDVYDVQLIENEVEFILIRQ
ncbi:MAG: hypothetical protein ACR2MM_12005 [Flavobacteriaceae bacterium]